jgi:hypothetical protein
MMGFFSCVCSGVLWGRVCLQSRILGGVIVSFLGGRGGEEEAPGQVLLSRFHSTTRAFKQPHFLCYILYIEQWRFHCCILQAIAKSALDLDALGSARALFRLRQPVCCYMLYVCYMSSSMGGS